MLNPVRVDAAVDLLYGGLIALSIGLILFLDESVGLAFGIGVFAAYALHVGWKMARFDPDWMTRVVEETVGETVGETVEESVGETVEKTVGETVEAQVGETVEKTVSETVEAQVGETVEKTVGETVEKTVGEQLESVEEEVKAVGERVDRRPKEDTVKELVEETVGQGTAEADEGNEDDDRDEDAVEGAQS